MSFNVISMTPPDSHVSLPIIYDSKPTKSEDNSTYTRLVYMYIAINPWQLYYKWVELKPGTEQNGTEQNERNEWNSRFSSQGRR